MEERVGVRCVHMMRYGACCCDCMSVFMVMCVCGGVPGAQLGGRCCWHGQWMCRVRVTGSVVGLAVFFWGVCAPHNFKGTCLTIITYVSMHMSCCFTCDL